MGLFRTFLEAKVFTAIKPDDIKWWAHYASSRIFKTPEEAQQWIFDRREHADKAPHASMFGGIDGPEFNRAFAQAMPLYQSGKSWKIGKRIRTNNRLRLKDLKIKMPDYEELVTIAQANGTAEFKFHKVRLIPLRFTVAAENDYYMTGQKDRIQRLANEIKQNRWIEPVVYDYPSMSIIEGQHRARAMKLLGFNMIPGIGIEYEED
jgi:hypothetical protein